MQYGIVIGQWAVLLLLAGIWCWMALALYFAGPRPLWWRYALILALLLSLPLTWWLALPPWQKITLLITVAASFLLWWISLRASNDRDWALEIANIPYGEIQQDILTLHNVRQFRYQSVNDFEQHWLTRQYDLSQMQSLDLFLCYWGSEHIAHIVMSWGFSNGDYLAISIETRKTRSQTYSPIRGFFKQFTLAYVASDEEDLIKLRTNHRRERVYYYPILNIPLQYKRHLLESYLRHMNKLQDRPEFYHVLFENCSSGISQHYKTLMPGRKWIDWRLIANGHLDELLYECNLIDTSKAFADVRQQARIDMKMQHYTGENFSAGLRNPSA